MKTFALIAIGVSALALTGCIRPGGHRTPLKPLARLDCPESQGPFQRASVAPDGMSCDYTGSDGAKLQLKLVSFTGDSTASASPVETKMKAMLPPPPAAPASNPPPTPPTDKDNVNINLPGISIHADDKNANVHVGNVHIDADGHDNTAHIHGGGNGTGQFTVDANDNGAVVRARSFGANFEESLILVSKTAGPDGWRSVGYEALGPKAGPLVLASFQSKTDEHDEMFNEVKALTRRAARGRG